MSSGQQILRQWTLLRMLQTRGEGVPLAVLARESGVSERTIQRDFLMLQKLGFPVQFDSDEFGKRFWRMPYNFFSSGSLAISVTEAVSLHLAEKLLVDLSGTHLAEGLQTVLKKIRSLIPRAALEYFGALDEMILVRRLGTTNYAAAGPTIRLLIDACRERTSVDLTYRSVWRNDQYATRFDPYGIVFYDGDVFVIGQSQRARDIRILKVSRILDPLLTKRRFERPTRFKLEQHFRSSFGIFSATGKTTSTTVRFTGVAAALVEERIWHETQRLSRQPIEETLFEPESDDDGALLATFHLSDFTEFKRWVKGFGELAEVVKPAWLRAELRAELLTAAAKYGG